MFKKNPLIQFAGIPVSGAAIRSCFPNLASPEKKVQALEKSGESIRIKRDLFIVNQELTGKETDVRLCANHIYRPSYVSFQWALRYYDMIPEQVFLMTSATTKRTRFFETPLGNFNYVQVPASYFPIGVECTEEQGIHFLMATREKALCDTILLEDLFPGSPSSHWQPTSRRISGLIWISWPSWIPISSSNAHVSDAKRKLSRI